MTSTRPPACHVTRWVQQAAAARLTGQTPPPPPSPTAAETRILERTLERLAEQLLHAVAVAPDLRTGALCAAGLELAHRWGLAAATDHLHKAACEALTSPDGERRALACRLLAWAARSDQVVREAVGDRLDDDCETVRAAAFDVISRCAVTHQDVRDRLMAWLRTKDHRRSTIACLTLARAAATSADVRAAIAACPGDDSPHLRPAALAVLWPLAAFPEARAAVAAALSGDEEDAVWNATDAVAMMHPETAVRLDPAPAPQSLFFRLLEDINVLSEECAGHAALAVAAAAAEWASVRRRVLERFAEPHNPPRPQYHLALSAAAAHEEASRAVLLNRLNHEPASIEAYFAVCQAAELIIGRRPEDHPDLVQALINRTTDPNLLLQNGACLALSGAAAAGHPATWRALTRLLDDDNLVTRRSAIIGLSPTLPETAVQCLAEQPWRGVPMWTRAMLLTLLNRFCNTEPVVEANTVMVGRLVAGANQPVGELFQAAVRAIMPHYGAPAIAGWTPWAPEAWPSPAAENAPAVPPSRPRRDDWMGHGSAGPRIIP